MSSRRGVVEMGPGQRDGTTDCTDNTDFWGILAQIDGRGDGGRKFTTPAHRGKLRGRMSAEVEEDFSPQRHNDTTGGRRV
ncbi:MAG: hypothetical protein ACP5I8_01745 [Phycisphaerae bacterium]